MKLMDAVTFIIGFLVCVIVATVIIASRQPSSKNSIKEFNEIDLSANHVTKYCMDGVSYLSLGHGLTVMLDKDSKVIPCTFHKGKQ